MNTITRRINPTASANDGLSRGRAITERQRAETLRRWRTANGAYSAGPRAFISAVAGEIDDGEDCATAREVFIIHNSRAFDNE